jgi:RNA polymerase sigma-70 factor (ECF subfamily)
MIEKGLEEVRPAYREVLILYYLDELSYQEIADVLRVPVGTVGVRIKRAREALRKVYEELNMHYEH